MKLKGQLTHIISFIVISALFYFLFTLNPFTFVAFVAGVAVTYPLLHLYGEKNGNETPIQLILAFIGAILVYFFFGNGLFVGAFLIGANITAYYIKLNPTKKIDTGIELLNVIALTGILLASGIEKFRGYNKIAGDDIQLTIPLIILGIYAVYFLVRLGNSFLSGKKKSYTYHILAVSVILSALVYYFVNYGLYREVGVGTLFAPLVMGLSAAIIEILVPKRSIIKDFLVVFLLLISPYAVAGLLGIGLSFLGGYLWIDLIAPAVKQKRIYPRTFDHLEPLLFLFAAAELRENAGQITRFNLITGYQTGWILISLVLIEYATRYYKTVVNILKENKIETLTSLVISIFTILVLTLIIKFGHDAALAALLLCSSIYLFLIDLVVTDEKKAKLQRVLALGNVVGAIAFLVLARI